jgi:hypothetical protein
MFFKYIPKKMLVRLEALAYWFLSNQHPPNKNSMGFLEQP